MKNSYEKSNPSLVYKIPLFVYVNIELKTVIVSPAVPTYLR